MSLPGYDIDGLSKRAYGKIPDYKRILVELLNGYRSGDYPTKWIHGADLARRLGLSEAEIRGITSYLRTQRKPTFFVASNGNGYCIAETVDEITQTFEQIDARYNKLGMVRLGLRRIMKILEDRETLKGIQGEMECHCVRREAQG